MKTPLILATLALSAALTGPALAGDSHTYYGPRGTSVDVSRSSNGDTASRSVNINGAYGGSASVSGSCTEGAGCTRSWSRTLRNGATASGTATAQRGVGVSRSGTGFRGRRW